MNTYLWGPPLWRILHTVSFAPPLTATTEKKQEKQEKHKKHEKHEKQDEEKQDEEKRYKRALHLLLLSLQRVLPCAFCRDSYVDFYHQLPHIPYLQKQDDIVHWVYDMHNLVNKKLNSMCTTLEYDCLYKRHAIRPVSCSTKDIWDVFAMLALNFPETPAETTQQLTKAMGVFLFTVVTLLNKYGVPHCAYILQYMDQFPPLFVNRSGFVNWVWGASVHTVNPLDYEVARATVCRDKTCK